MIYSIINLNGFQYNVRLGQSFKVPKINMTIGKEVKITDVLMTNDGSESQIGTPFVDQSSVSFEVLDHGKYDKIIIFKHKRRKGYRKTAGHRQLYTEVIVTTIQNASNKHIVEEQTLIRNRSRVKTLKLQKLPAVKKVTQKVTDSLESVKA